MPDFRDFLLDFLKVIAPYQDVISHALMRRTPEGDLLAAAQAKDSSILVKATAKHPVEEFHDVACLGTLPYLKQVLESRRLGSKATEVTLDYKTASDGQTEALYAITFNGKTAQAFYRATDPFLHKLTTMREVKITEWPALFGLDVATAESFIDMAKVHASAPKTGTDRDDIFKLVLDGDQIVAIFGDKSHQSHVTLSEEAERTTDRDKINALFVISHFRAILNQLRGEDVLVAYLSDKALRIDMETPQAVYTYTMTAKKLA